MSTPSGENSAVRGTYHHGDLRQTFLDAALESLDTHGELPSWRALARACSVSQTAPYRHFANFESLQAAVAAAAFERLSAAIEAATQGQRDPFDRLAAGLRAYVQFGRQHPSWYELMFGRNLNLLKRDEASAAGTAAYGTLVAAIAGCGVRAAPAAAFTLWSAVHGITDLARSGLRPPIASDDGANPLDDMLTMCVAHIRALAARATSPQKARAKPARRQ